MKKRSTENAGRRSDNRAIAVIDAAGWQSSFTRHDNGRFIAVKRIREEDDSTTSLFESAYTLETLAKQVKRREEEEAR